MEGKLNDDPLLAGVPEIDGYKVLDPAVLYDKIGEGGMGTVYRGRHVTLDVDVAVKLLAPDLARTSGDFITRFQREAKLAAKIRHHNLIGVFDVRQAHGLHYIVMEFVEGESAFELEVAAENRRLGGVPRQSGQHGIGVDLDPRRQIAKQIRSLGPIGPKLEQGVYLAPSPFECGFASLAHQSRDIDATLAAARVAMKKAARVR